MIRTVAILSAALLGLGLGQPGVALAQDSHAGHAPHGERHAARPTLNHGRRWATDAPLRQGMAAIRQAAQAPGRDDAAFAAAIETQLDFIIANCRLPEDADAQLHVVVERLFEAARQLSAGHGPAGRAEASEALAAYGEAFDHPGWR